MLPITITEIAELDVDGRYIVLSVPAIGIEFDDRAGYRRHADPGPAALRHYSYFARSLSSSPVF